LEGWAEFQADLEELNRKLLPLLDKSTHMSAHYQGSRGTTKISEIVIHDTGSTHPFNRTAKYLAHPKDGRKVSIHYLIGREVGQFVDMAPEDRRANHAIGHNRKSIGIELWRHKTYKGDFTWWQYNVLSQLVYDIMRRRSITLSGIVGHGDIYRAKRGEPHGFDWDRFYFLILVINEKARAINSEFNVL
jgi:N-acetyl-anhydromuramyl-L-alanine amidase AmpD